MSCCPKTYSTNTLAYGAVSNSGWSETQQKYVAGLGGNAHLVTVGGGEAVAHVPNTSASFPIFLPDGTIWHVISGGYGAGLGDQPDGGPSLSSSVLYLQQLRDDGGAANSEFLSIVLESNQSPLGSSGDFDADITTATYDEWNTAGIDYNPVDGLIYFGIDRKAGTATAPYFQTPVVPYHAQVWVTNVAGTHSMLFDAGPDSTIADLAAASDGSVWCVTAPVVDAYGKRIYRKPLGSSTFTELTLTGDVSSFVGHAQFAIVGKGIPTPWGAFLYPMEDRAVSFLQQYYEVRPDGATKIWRCPRMENTGSPISPMRTLDFQRTYAFMYDPYPQVHLMVFDWKKCGSGWVVGGMAMNG